MTGRRKIKGLAPRKIESARRAGDHYRRRLARAKSPTERVRITADLLCALLRRVDPLVAETAVSLIVTGLAPIIRKLEQEVSK